MGVPSIQDQVSLLIGEIKTLKEIVKPIMDRSVILHQSEYNLIKKAIDYLLDNDKDSEICINVVRSLLDAVVHTVDDRIKSQDQDGG